MGCSPCGRKESDTTSNSAQPSPAVINIGKRGSLESGWNESREVFEESSLNFLEKTVVAEILATLSPSEAQHRKYSY